LRMPQTRNPKLVTRNLIFLSALCLPRRSERSYWGAMHYALNPKLVTRNAQLRQSLTVI